MTEKLHRLGHDVLGPAFATFARLLLHEAERDGVGVLAFVARDGDFLRQVTSRLHDRLQLRFRIVLDYVYLSRLSTTLAQYSSFAEALRAEEAGIFGARAIDVAGIFAYFGVDVASLQSFLARHDLTPQAPVPSAATLAPLLSDVAFQSVMAGERDRQRQLLSDYLATANLWRPNTALVDLGWRGSIAAALASAFPVHYEDQPLRAYYLGYWDEYGRGASSRCSAKGLLTDYRRSRSPVEGAAYHVAYILEAICRAPHGTVAGYALDAAGVVAPVLSELGPNRDAERRGESWREPIRRGIEDYIDAHADEYKNIDPQRARRKAQRRLFRLAFFPTNDEMEALSGLVHTEGYAPNWVGPLVDRTRPSPIRSPRRWIAGLASPWRSGYVRATGGLPLALAFTALEFLLAIPAIRKIVRKLALAAAKR